MDFVRADIAGTPEIGFSWDYERDELVCEIIIKGKKAGTEYIKDILSIRLAADQLMPVELRDELVTRLPIKDRIERISFTGRDMETGIENTLARLAAPFKPGELEWRGEPRGVDVRSMKTGEKCKVLVFTYVQARAIQNRLDAVLGGQNWYDRYEAGPAGGVICSLSLRLGDEWITTSSISKISFGIARCSGKLCRPIIH